MTKGLPTQTGHSRAPPARFLDVREAKNGLAQILTLFPMMQIDRSLLLLTGTNPDLSVKIMGFLSRPNRCSRWRLPTSKPVDGLAERHTRQTFGLGPKTLCVFGVVGPLGVTARCIFCTDRLGDLAIG